MTDSQGQLRDVNAFVSLYRTGTQWIAHMFGAVYDDLIAIRHEPVGQSPLFREASHQRLQQHMDRIETLEYPYFEVGWPTFNMLPHYRERFGTIPTVHLVRHPIDTAISAERASLDKFVMSLRRWYKVNKHIMQDLREPPWKVQKIERLWDGSDLQELVEFFGLPYREELETWTTTTIDNHVLKPVPNVDLSRLEQMPDLENLAKTLGYSLNPETSKYVLT